MKCENRFTSRAPSSLEPSVLIGPHPQHYRQLAERPGTPMVDRTGRDGARATPCSLSEAHLGHLRARHDASPRPLGSPPAYRYHPEAPARPEDGGFPETEGKEDSHRRGAAISPRSCVTSTRNVNVAFAHCSQENS